MLVAKVEEDKLIKPTELSFCSSCVHIRLHFILPSVILFKAAAAVFAADPMKVSLPSTSMQLIINLMALEVSLPSEPLAPGVSSPAGQGERRE